MQLKTFACNLVSRPWRTYELVCCDEVEGFFDPGEFLLFAKKIISKNHHPGAVQSAAELVMKATIDAEQ